MLAPLSILSRPHNLSLSSLLRYLFTTSSHNIPSYILHEYYQERSVIALQKSLLSHCNYNRTRSLAQCANLVLYRAKLERDWKKLLGTGDGVENKDVAILVRSDGHIGKMIILSGLNGEGDMSLDSLKGYLGRYI